MRLKYKFQRLYKYEFWPWWIFYAPFFFQWLYYSIKSGSFLYFTNVNFDWNLGGLMQYSKFKAIKDIPKQFLPETKFYKYHKNYQPLLNHGLNYPLIYKPDKGERGKHVEIINDEQTLLNTINTYKEDFLLQEYVQLPVELGVLYFKFPNGKSGITSIVLKEFLTIVGNGTDTLRQLLSEHLRAVARMEDWEQIFSKEELEKVIPKNKSIIIEPIGNHCRGTKFLNGNYLINNYLTKVFDEIAQNINGFHYGRFDLKTTSIDDLHKGKNIKIFELNGVNSEAAHIYQPGYGLWNAYKDVYKNLKLVYQISRQNKKLGIPPQSLKVFFEAFKAHFVKNKGN
ncbi:MAG: carboxylate--amine ligase [Vicingaceae bacterium]